MTRMRDLQTTVQPGRALVAMALMSVLVGCASVPRSGGGTGPWGTAGDTSALRFGAAGPDDTEGFTEAAYRELIEELGAATERLADESAGLDPGVRGDLLLHMAVAYQGLSQYERVMDQQRYDEAMRVCVDRGRDDCHDRVRPDFSRSDSLEDAARTCVSMLRRIRAHERTESLREKLRTR